jgi:hypothetical protein
MDVDAKSASLKRAWVEAQVAVAVVVPIDGDIA